jgi:transposase-like protein
MGKQRSYSWEFKLQMVQLLEQDEQNPSQISRDHHVTRSLLYLWRQLYRERGEAAFVPTQAFQSPPQVDRPRNAEEQIAHLERLCGQQALELDLLKAEVELLKKAWHLLPSNSDMPS